MSHLPRKGQYELFFHSGKVYCFDDLDVSFWIEHLDMITWLNQQDHLSCRPYRLSNDKKPTAWYLDPETYMLWKLRWI